ncbi:MAG: hypothetical protein K9L68_14245 [Spirochaetales bacterium]|nr:hypothetical protein [Spirochaetales bacterium]
MILLLPSVSAQNRTESGDSVTLSLRLYNKQIYFEDSTVEMLAEIRNEGSKEFSFQLAEEHMLNLDIELKTARNRRDRIERKSPPWNDIRPILYREMTLKPGERFSFHLRLSRYYELDESGTYYLRAAFYPSMINSIIHGASYQRRSGEEFSEQQAVFSEWLPITIEPGSSSGFPQEDLQELAKSEAPILTARSMPPDEVVEYTLKARQNENWNKFFLYMDIEKIYRQTDEHDDLYRYSSQEERTRLLDEFKSLLKQEKIDNGAISLKPLDFDIIQTTYQDRKGEVLAKVRYGYPNYTETKWFRYTLERITGIWYITGYTVETRTTE